MVNMSAKIDEVAHSGLVSIMFTSLLPYRSIVILTFAPNINRVHPLNMANMSAKFDGEAHNHLVSIVFTSLFPYMSIVTLTFDLNINRVHPLVMVNMSAKFDDKVHNGLVSIAFTRSKQDRQMHTLTDGWTDGRNHSSITISPPQRVARGIITFSLTLEINRVTSLIINTHTCHIFLGHSGIFRDFLLGQITFFWHKYCKILGHFPGHFE